jgi:hypothetical protein
MNELNILQNKLKMEKFKYKFFSRAIFLFVRLLNVGNRKFKNQKQVGLQKKLNICAHKTETLGYAIY